MLEYKKWYCSGFALIDDDDLDLESVTEEFGVTGSFTDLGMFFDSGNVFLSWRLLTIT